MSGLSLYQIEAEYQQLAAQLMDDELTPELETALSINKENLQNKAVNYGFVLKQFDAEVDIINAEIERLKTLKERRTKGIDKLKQTLSLAMQLYGIEKIETPIMKISFRQSESVEVDNVALLNQKFVIQKVTVSPDKAAIKKAIQAGEEVTGAFIQINQNLQIK
jgi:hypothetical protein